MPVKLSNILKDKPGDTGVDPAVREYEHRFSMAKGGASEDVELSEKKVSDLPTTSRRPATHRTNVQSMARSSGC